jgi:hypothetical protein
MKRVLGTLFVTAVALVLAVYSAMRSLDFINLTLPPEQAAMGYLALVATEGGIFCWLIYYLHGADGAWQRGISLVMTIIDLVGSIALFTADTLLQAGRNGLAVGLAPDEIRMVIMGLSALIALNIAATVCCHLFDPENLKRAAEQEAFSAVQDATLAQISQNANTLASELAPVLSADWMRDTRARYTAALGSGVIPSTATVIDGKAKDSKPFEAQAQPYRRATQRAYMGKRRAPAPGADPGMVAAVLAALAMDPRAVQQTPVTYQAETAGTPPLAHAPIAGGE